MRLLYYAITKRFPIRLKQTSSEEHHQRKPVLYAMLQILRLTSKTSSCNIKRRLQERYLKVKLHSLYIC